MAVVHLSCLNFGNSNGIKYENPFPYSVGLVYSSNDGKICASLLKRLLGSNKKLSTAKPNNARNKLQSK